eukprot:4298017-Amphidinium_carterae.1
MTTQLTTATPMTLQAITKTTQTRGCSPCYGAYRVHPPKRSKVNGKVNNNNNDNDNDNDDNDSDGKYK